MEFNDFSKALKKFMTYYLPTIRSASARTIDSYRYTFILFLDYMNSVQHKEPSMVTIQDINHSNVTSFLAWLETVKGNKANTVNQRHAAISCYCRFLGHEYPEYLLDMNNTLAIPYKKAESKAISYVSKEGVELITSLPNIETGDGLRDKLILCLLFSTGVRVSELIQIRVRDVSLSQPRSILIHGKGGKDRFVPIAKQYIPLFRKYFEINELDLSVNHSQWLFKNHQHLQLSRQGVDYILKKYAALARKEKPTLFSRSISPHVARHSVAMNLLESGVPLLYIRDLLGHSSVVTTEVYARASETAKCRAIEKASAAFFPKEEPKWKKEGDILSWLKSSK